MDDIIAEIILDYKNIAYTVSNIDLILLINIIDCIRSLLRTVRVIPCISDIAMNVWLLANVNLASLV